ncbi:hypothetical protein KBZ00_25855 [Streptomyces sp. RK31]|uniref:hypothetical protein n=1 Tax=Streptomyces sp. RK31 TaxID=2824892 RepID=UPI001B35D137|nr:hypothetical protein [Streptomyces sp. RK31]MBQ0974525.1 hypothetical protein [Streptomyces sp. RK31]
MTEHQQPPRGAWPVLHPVDLDAIGTDHDDQQAEHEHGEQYTRAQRERARYELVLDSIRYDLQQHPSPATVRAAARHWCMRITTAADEIAKEKSA